MIGAVDRPSGPESWCERRSVSYRAVARPEVLEVHS